MDWLKNKARRFPMLYAFLKWLNSLRKKLLISFNAIGNNKCCYVCKKTFFVFEKLLIPPLSTYYKHLNPIGSLLNDFGCPFCLCNDRERHLFAYFDKLNLWPQKSNRVLHFAPEFHLCKKIESCNPLEYIKADYTPESYKNIHDVRKIDLMDIPFEKNYFDIVICNHVLEHIHNMPKGLAEIHRVLKTGGFAILQTPFSQLLYKHFEDPGINTDEQREFFYGQNDHLRIVSEKQFLEDLENQGFKLTVVKHEELFDGDFAKYYGVNSRENLIMVVK